MVIIIYCITDYNLKIYLILHFYSSCSNFYYFIPYLFKLIMLLKTRILQFQNCFPKLQYDSVHNWTKPEGFNTGIRVYNCITKNKEPLVIKNNNLITWYTCGPTVYDSAHVGHASCYVKLDIIQNILRNYFKYNLITVMNITDIDDKIIKRATQIKKNYKDVATQYEKEFFEDLNTLGISKSNIILRVTEHMDLIIKFIRQLENKGKAYKTSDNSVYFAVERENYGKLVNISNQIKEDVTTTGKRSQMDFVLWKNSKEGEPYWHSPWCTGRPGWHIECSALASHALGSNIDIHAGGMDLKFPHHENEEAQSCAFHETQQWINYWLHVGHLHLKDSEKMSKSLKNTVSIQEMLKNTKVEVFRLACAMSRYRSSIEYSKELLETTKNLYQVYKNLITSCDDYKKGYLKATVNNDVLLKLLSDSYLSVHEALCDDFNTPDVIRTLNELVSVTNSMLHTTTSSDTQNGLYSVTAVSNFLLNVLSLFGVNFEEKTSRDSEDFTEIMNILNQFRQDVRLIGLEQKNKEVLKLCDNVREKLKDSNIIVKDFGKISSWST